MINYNSGNKPGRPTVPRTNRRELIEKFLSGEMNQSELARHYGVAKMTVNEIIRYELSPRQIRSAMAMEKSKKVLKRQFSPSSTSF